MVQQDYEQLAAMSLKDKFELVMGMSREALVAFIDGDKRIKERVEAKAPSHWRENPHWYRVQIIGALNYINMGDEDWYNKRVKDRAALGICP